MQYSQKEALDFVWKRKKFPEKSFFILVDDVFHQPFLGVLSFWAWFSGCNSIKLLDRNQKEMELPAFRKTFFPLLMDLLKWPFVFRYHQKIVGHLETSTPFYFPILSPENILYLRTDQWFQY